MYIHNTINWEVYPLPADRDRVVHSYITCILLSSSIPYNIFNSQFHEDDLTSSSISALYSAFLIIHLLKLNQLHESKYFFVHSLYADVLWMGSDSLRSIADMRPPSWEVVVVYQLLFACCRRAFTNRLESGLSRGCCVCFNEFNRRGCSHYRLEWRRRKTGICCLWSSQHFI